MNFVYASVVTTKPGGTLKPAFVKIVRLEAFPPVMGCVSASM